MPPAADVAGLHRGGGGLSPNVSGMLPLLFERWAPVGRDTRILHSCVRIECGGIHKLVYLDDVDDDAAGICLV